MKRILVLLICFSMLTVGCFLSGQAPDGSESPSPEAEATPFQSAEPTADPSESEDQGDTVISEPTATPYVPDLSVLPLLYSIFDEDNWSTSEATMFRFDVDFDGEEEEISYRCSEDEDCTVLTIGSESFRLTGSNPDRAILIDLDPRTPYVNLLISIGRASGEFITTELHCTGGQIVKGTEIESYWTWDAEKEALVFYETTDLLGTLVGMRTRSGEDLKPNEAWLEVSSRISDDQLAQSRDELIQSGLLLHLKQDLPCEIDGQSAILNADTCIYAIRFNSAQDTAEIRTEDGTAAFLHFTVSDLRCFIDGKPVTWYFDNLHFAG